MTAEDLDDLEELCDLAVRGLEELIDYQDYPIIGNRVDHQGCRSLGIGFIGLSHYLAKLGHGYDSQEAWDAVHELTESFQYYLLKASNELDKEKGHCEYFGRTKYSSGTLPIDTYKKDVDEITSVELKHDWIVLSEILFWNMDLGTQHCPHRCHRRSSSVVSNKPMGSALLVDTCPLRNRKRDLLSRLFRVLNSEE